MAPLLFQPLLLDVAHALLQRLGALGLVLRQCVLPLALQPVQLLAPGRVHAAALFGLADRAGQRLRARALHRLEQAHRAARRRVPAGQLDQRVERGLPVGQVGDAELVAGQARALLLHQLRGQLEVLARLGGAAAPLQQAADRGAAGHGRLRQCRRRLQRALHRLQRVVVPALGHQHARCQQLGLGAPAVDAGVGERHGSIARQGRGPVDVTQFEPQVRQAQVGQRRAHGTAVRHEQFACPAQPLRGQPGLAAARQRLGTLQFGPGPLHRRVQRFAGGDGLVVQRDGLRQQVQRQVRVGQVAPGLGHVVRHAVLLGLAHRGVQAGQRGVEVTAMQLEPPPVGVDHALQVVQLARSHPHRGAVVQALRFVELVQPGQRAGQTDVGHDRVTHIAGAREAHGRLAIEGRCGLVPVLPQQHRPEVELGLARPQLVAAFDQAGTHPLGTGDGLVVAAEHRQRDQPGDLRLRGAQLLAQRLQRASRDVEAVQRLVHLAAGELLHAGAPGGRGLHLGRGRRPGQPGERSRTAPGAIGVGRPRGDRLVLQGPGQRLLFCRRAPVERGHRRRRAVGEFAHPFLEGLRHGDHCPWGTDSSGSTTSTVPRRMLSV